MMLKYILTVILPQKYQFFSNNSQAGVVNVSPLPNKLMQELIKSFFGFMI